MFPEVAPARPYMQLTFAVVHSLDYLLLLQPSFLSRQTHASGTHACNVARRSRHRSCVKRPPAVSHQLLDGLTEPLTLCKQCSIHFWWRIDPGARER